MYIALPQQLAFVFTLLCLGGILFLMLLVSVVRRNHGNIDTSDGCLASFISLLLAIAAIIALAVSIF